MSAFAFLCLPDKRVRSNIAFLLKGGYVVCVIVSVVYMHSHYFIKHLICAELYNFTFYNH